MEELKEKAVFVGIIRQNDDDRKVMEYLDELEFLAETAGAKGDRKFVQRLDKPEKATYIRSGKLQEIAQYCEDNEINYVIFDDELTGMQQRNIEKVISCSSVIDRTSLILEIFAQRAKTSYAKMQVELARYNYMLPRLAGMWTHLASRVLLKASTSCVGNFLMNPTVSLRRNGTFSITTFLTVVSSVANNLFSAKTSDLASRFIIVLLPTLV